jgi:murein DD-endopeptidase MepM/ murein hydrolase activator NlpD
VVPTIAFPVLGPVTYADGWGSPRGVHGERRHEGTDLFGVTGQPLRAAFAGVVTRRQIANRGIAGVVITITRADGLRANYFHLNDDHPGTRDGRAPASWRIPASVRLHSTVLAGQVIGFMGDSGNAVGVPHLHFELRLPDGSPLNPYPALLAAADREQCAVAFGPWANVGTPVDRPIVAVATVHGRGGARWLISADGEIVAVGMTASSVGQGAPCTVVG